MQLRTMIGYRGIHGRICGKQELCSRNKCQCNVIGHQCKEHRIDPREHRSRKVAKFTKEQKQSKREEEEKKMQAKPGRKKKAPEVERSIGEARQSIAQKVSKEVEFKRRQAGEELKLTPHNAKMLERINKREGAEGAESGPGTSADKLGQPKHQKTLR